MSGERGLCEGLLSTWPLKTSSAVVTLWWAFNGTWISHILCTFCETLSQTSPQTVIMNILVLFLLSPTQPNYLWVNLYFWPSFMQEKWMKKCNTQSSAHLEGLFLPLPSHTFWGAIVLSHPLFEWCYHTEQNYETGPLFSFLGDSRELPTEPCMLVEEEVSM